MQIRRMSSRSDMVWSVLRSSHCDYSRLRMCEAKRFSTTRQSNFWEMPSTSPVDWECVRKLLTAASNLGGCI